MLFNSQKMPPKLKKNTFSSTVIDAAAEYAFEATQDLNTAIK